MYSSTEERPLAEYLELKQIDQSINQSGFITEYNEARERISAIRADKNVS